MLHGKKTSIGLMLTALAEIFNEVAKVLDADPATDLDLKIVFAAAVLLYGAIDRLIDGGTPTMQDVKRLETK